MLSDVVVRIQGTARGKTRVVHADRLKLYEGPALVSWVYKAPKTVEERGPELHKVGGGDPVVPTEETGGNTTGANAGERMVANEGVVAAGGLVKDMGSNQDGVEEETVRRGREVDNSDRAGQEIVTKGEEQKGPKEAAEVKGSPSAGDQEAVSSVSMHNVTGRNRDGEGDGGESRGGLPRRSPRENRRRPARYR